MTIWWLARFSLWRKHRRIAALRRRRPPYPAGQWQAWGIVHDGLRMNVERFLGATQLPQRRVVCDDPECTEQAHELVKCEGNHLLVCRAHFWPAEVARIHRAHSHARATA